MFKLFFAVDTFCMFVYSCFVVDPAGIDRLDLIDETGCATDKYLMGNIEYPSDLMGVKEVHVFKYADRPALFFQCQINIAVKEPNAECIRPDCSEPGGSGNTIADFIVTFQFSCVTYNVHCMYEQ